MNAILRKGSSFTWQTLWRESTLSEMVIYGELEIDKLLIFGEMLRSQIVQIGKLLLLDEGTFCQRFIMILLIPS